uniref:Zinc finger, CCHC-type n=1 Tax=Tanacetum cinerariifolium TaxID=118510 RepID=A0A699HA47_TANCI|nr:zinc finger, CCHC-type [Tanacetum cinerariifolium]
MLKPSNYSLWEIRMQIILEANGLWEMIEPNEKTQADNKKDKTAITFLYQALPEEQLLQITKHKTAKAIWDALKTRHIGEERVQQARLQTLKSDFKMLHMKEDETIDTFTGKVTTLVNKAASLGHTMEDETLVRKLLNAVPDRDMTKDSGYSSKKETSTTSTPHFQCPMLKPSNYSLWVIRMQIILEANGLWEMKEPNEKTQVDNKKDKMLSHSFTKPYQKNNCFKSQNTKPQKPYGMP